jgi:hypothetical protein
MRLARQENDVSKGNGKGTGKGGSNGGRKKQSKAMVPPAFFPTLPFGLFLLPLCVSLPDAGKPAKNEVQAH